MTDVSALCHGVSDSLSWEGSKVLITGADGFIGSHLTQRLVELGAKVAVMVRPRSVTGTSENRLRNLRSEASRLDKIIAVDVAGPDASSAVIEYGAQVVFHLAADAYVNRSFEFPGEVVRTNVTGTLNVLEAARRCPNLKRLVVTSSSEVYGPAQTEQINEEHPLEPTSPYAASKVAADRLAMTYYRTFQTPVAVIRPFNTFGPRHVYDVIPKFIGAALRGDPLVIYGTGEQSRDFTYVDDMVDAFVCMGSHPAAVGTTVNFGTGRATSIAQLAQDVLEATGSRVPVEHVGARRAEVERLCCDASLARSRLGWAPRVSLSEGLRRNVEWFLSEHSQ